MLLVPKDQIRMATMEEASAPDTIAKDLALTADKKCYQDMTGLGDVRDQGLKGLVVVCTGGARRLELLGDSM